jgi:proteasome assembly chaperone 3
MGQLYASQIASTIITKNPDERRLLVLGLGFAKVEMEREAYFDVVELVLKCL